MISENWDQFCEWTTVRAHFVTMCAKWIFCIFIFAAKLRVGITMPKCANPPAKIDTFPTLLESQHNLLFWDRVNNPAGFPVNIRNPVMLYSLQDR